MTFQLPPNVTAQRKPISPTSYEYVLRHSELGQIGRILLNACVTGDCKVTYQVYGHVGDAMTAQRREVFVPLAISLTEQIKSASKLGTAKTVN